jgi:transcriptional regulator with XRE-family HTH domain
MRSEAVKRVLERTPKDVKIFVSLYSALVIRINAIMREQGLSQNQLASRMDKRPSEISKWLKGSHNLTLRSIAKLQAELGETLITIPETKAPAFFKGEKVAKHRSLRLNADPSSLQTAGFRPARPAGKSESHNPFEPIAA